MRKGHFREIFVCHKKYADVKKNILNFYGLRVNAIVGGFERRHDVMKNTSMDASSAVMSPEGVKLALRRTQIKLFPHIKKKKMHSLNLILFIKFILQ